MIDEEREKANATVLALKLALVTHDPVTYLPALFGEDQPVSSMSAPTTRIEAPVEPDIDLAAPDGTEGEWQFTETVSPEEAQALMASMLADSTGTLVSDGEWH